MLTPRAGPALFSNSLVIFISELVDFEANDLFDNSLFSGEVAQELKRPVPDDNFMLEFMQLLVFLVSVYVPVSYSDIDGTDKSDQDGTNGHVECEVQE